MDNLIINHDKPEFPQISWGQFKQKRDIISPCPHKVRTNPQNRWIKKDSKTLILNNFKNLLRYPRL